MRNIAGEAAEPLCGQMPQGLGLEVKQMHGFTADTVLANRR